MTDLDNMLELIETFNSTLERIKKGELWIEDESRTPEEQEKHIELFGRLLDTLVTTTLEVEKQLGRRLTKEECIGGIK